RSFGNSVLGRSFAEGFGYLPLRRHRSGGALVVRPDCAACQRAGPHQGSKPQDETTLAFRKKTHQGFFSDGDAELAAFCGLLAGAFAGGGAVGFATCFTCTCWPSSNESGGFSTIH